MDEERRKRLIENAEDDENPAFSGFGDDLPPEPPETPLTTPQNVTPITSTNPNTNPNPSQDPNQGPGSTAGERGARDERPSERPSRPGLHDRPLGKVGRPKLTEEQKRERVHIQNDPKTPLPPFKRYWTEAGNQDQRPGKLLKWIDELPKWAKERLVLYIYRDWPVLVQITAEDKELAKATGGFQALEHNYIDKVSVNSPEMYREIVNLRDRYGSGDYKITVKDDQVEKRALCEAHIRESWRDIRTYPPSDRRIDNPRNVDLNDPLNKSYLKFLEAQGKLPQEGGEKKDDMAEVAAVSQMTGLVTKLVDKLNTKQGGEGEATSKAFDVLADATKKGQDILVESMKRAEDAKAAMPNPVDQLDKVLSIVDKIRPPQSSDSAMVQSFMSNMMEMQKTIISIQNERISFAEKVALESKRGGNGEGQGGGDEDSTTKGVKRLLELANLLGLKRGGAEAAASAGPDWKEMIPDMLQGAGGIISSIVTAYQTRVYAEAVAKGQNPAPPPPPQQQPQAGAGVEPDQAPMNGNGNGPQAMSPAELSDDQRNYLAFMNLIRRPLLNHINNGWGGEEFAEVLIKITDQGMYDAVKMKGSETFTMMIKSYPPIANELVGKEEVLAKFVDEFMRAEEIWDQQEQETETGALA